MIVFNSFYIYFFIIATRDEHNHATNGSPNDHGQDQNKVVLVVLSIGSLYVEKPQLQLSLALLIKSKFPHLMKRMLVYDPVITSTEYFIIKSPNLPIFYIIWFVS